MNPVWPKVVGLRGPCTSLKNLSAQTPTANGPGRMYRIHGNSDPGFHAQSPDRGREGRLGIALPPPHGVTFTHHESPLASMRNFPQEALPIRLKAKIYQILPIPPNQRIPTNLETSHLIRRFPLRWLSSPHPIST
jgi:hypothetical protein